MLHKCANPSCENAFLKLTQGKLFLVETDQAYARGLSIVSKRTQRRIEHYWLCDACAPVLTLAYERGRGIVAVPLTAPPPQKMPPTAELPTEVTAAAVASASHSYYRRA